MSDPGGGSSAAFPDVCNTYVVKAEIPLTYPNTGALNTATNGCMKILILCAPAHNTSTTTAVTSGDELGILGGLISNSTMGTSQTLLGSTNLMLQGMPAAKMLGVTGHNGSLPNTVGSTLAPSQTKVMSLR